MPDDQAPATPDELAALYLRGRDVPCPGCGYNRRDGTAAACPECRADLGLATPDPVVRVVLRRRPAVAILVIISLGALLGLFSYGGGTLTLAQSLVSQALAPTTGLIVLLAVYFWGGFGCAFACYLCVRLLHNLWRRNITAERNGRTLIAVAAWLTAAFLPEVIYGLIPYFQWLRSLL